METLLEHDAAHVDRAEDGPFPTLQRLGLGDEELVALRLKGYLTQDDRGHGHDGYWRLRFRFDGRSRAVYLGRDLRLVDQVRNELKALQSQRDEDRRMSKVTRKGKEIMRAAKRRLEPVLMQLGFHYHGDLIRKIRGDKSLDR